MLKKDVKNMQELEKQKKAKETEIERLEAIRTNDDSEISDIMLQERFGGN